MGRIAALGEGIRVQGFGLAGALVLPAETPEAVRAAWRDLPADVAVVIVTPTATRALPDIASDGAPMMVVMPP